MGLMDEGQLTLELEFRLLAILVSRRCSRTVQLRLGKTSRSPSLT